MKQKTKTNRKGQVGFDTTKMVMLTLLSVGVLGFLIIIMLGSLTDTTVATTSGSFGPTSQTVTNVAHTARPLTPNGLLDCSATISAVVNSTSGTTIPASNYTLSGCTILYKTGQGNANGFNDTSWIVNYTATYNSFGTINSNISTGTVNFFTNTSTWFSLLAIVVIILIIAIVIFAVNRFGGKETGF